MIPVMDDAGKHRLPKNVVALFFLTILSAASHLTGQGAIGVVLFPFVLVIVGFDSFSVLWACMAGFLVFFPPDLAASNMGVLNTPDLALVAFFLHSLLKRDSLSFQIPISKLLIITYAFVLFCLAVSPPAIFKYGPLDMWVFRDIKALLYLGLAAGISRTPDLGFKNLVHLLLWMVTFTSVHSLFCLLQYAATQDRVMTWNEIYMADAALLGSIFLWLPQLKRWRLALGASLALNMLGLLVAETRGVWLATVFSFCLGIAVLILGADRVRLSQISKGLGTATLVAIIVGFAIHFAFDYNIIEHITSRFAEGSLVELADPSSSMGYRLHESLSVWQKRSWLGHGAGARLHLYFTQLNNKNRIMDWWSIHSEYFEILHKFGIVGLSLFMLLMATIAWFALRLSLTGKKSLCIMGLAVLLPLAIHMVASITSGYIIREHTAILFAIFILILERFYPRLSLFSASRVRR